MRELNAVPSSPVPGRCVPTHAGGSPGAGPRSHAWGPGRGSPRSRPSSKSPGKAQGERAREGALPGLGAPPGSSHSGLTGAELRSLPLPPPPEGGRGSPALPCGGCGPRPSPASWPHPSQDAHTPRLAPSFSETLGSVLPSLSKEEGHPSSGTPPGGLSGCLRDLGGGAGEGLCLGRP